MKQKQCSECPYVGPLWKSKPALCQSCSRKYQKPVNKVSEKRAIENKEYSILRKEYLIKHPDCKAKLIGCTIQATDIHHKYSGKDRAANFLKTESWLSLCRHCHDQIHSKLSKEENINLNFKQ